MSREVYEQVLSSQQFALQLNHSAAQSRRPCTWRRLISYSCLNQHWFFYSTDICRIHLGAASQTVSVRHDSQQIHWINSLSCRYDLHFGRVEISDLGSDSTATLHHPRLSRWADFPSVISQMRASLLTGASSNFSPRKLALSTSFIYWVTLLTIIPFYAKG